MTSNHVKMWYAMSAPYGREQMAVELLDKESGVGGCGFADGRGGTTGRGVGEIAALAARGIGTQ